MTKITKLNTDIFILNIGGIHGDKSKVTIESTMSSSRELPMPNITRIFSLNQADATLLLCWTKLSKFNQEQTPTYSAWSPNSVANERQNFQQWLEQWELAFTAFLSNAMVSMTNDDVMHSRILKSNHLAFTIMVSDTPFDCFEVEFRAIIELAGPVLRWRHVSDSPQDTRPDKGTMPVSPGLDVQEPLLAVMSRCTQESLRIRANELLSIFYQ